jgi:O-Antigen ligase
LFPCEGPRGHLRALAILFAALILIAAVVLVGLRIVKATRLWPAALLILTAPLEVYRSSSGAGANVSLFRLALVVAIAAFIFDLARGRMSFPKALAVPFVIYGALVTWQLVSLAFVTPNHSLAYRFLGQYAGGLVAAFIISCYVERRDLRVVAGLCGSAVVLPLLAAAYRVFSVSQGGSGDLPGLAELPLNPSIEAARQGGSFLLDGTQRLNATFSDPNHFGFYAATVFVVLLGVACDSLFRERPIHWKAATSYLLLMFATALAIIGTYSRSSWLLTAVGVAVMAALLGRSFWTSRRAIIAGVVAIVALGLAAPLFVSRLSTSEQGNALSTKEHEHTMSIALKLVVHHPFSGVGLGDYGHYAGQPSIISSAHSTFLTVSAELGIPGLTLLAFAIAMTSLAAVRSARHGPSTDRVILAGFAAAYVGLATANILYEVWMDDFQWVLFGLVVALTTQRPMSLALAPLHRWQGVAHGRASSKTSEHTKVALCSS